MALNSAAVAAATAVVSPRTDSPESVTSPRTATNTPAPASSAAHPVLHISSSTLVDGLTVFMMIS